MKGLRPERPERSGGSVESKHNNCALEEGEARRRGGGTIYAAAFSSPEQDGLLGCAGLGGHYPINAPRCFLRLTGNVTVCEGRR